MAKPKAPGPKAKAPGSTPAPSAGSARTRKRPSPTSVADSRQMLREAAWRQMFGGSSRNPFVR